MKAFNGYAETKASGSSFPRLAPGGYVLKIMDVKLIPGTNGNSDRLQVFYDVTEGDQAGYYKKQYASQQGEDKKWKGRADVWCPKDDGSEQDNWTKSKFKGFTTSVEESNDGYHWDWDENKLKGKIIGGVFGDKEYDVDGKNGFYTALRFWVSAETIRQSDYKVPDPLYLKGKAAAPTTSDGFMSIPDGDDDELPFK